MKIIKIVLVCIVMLVVWSSVAVAAQPIAIGRIVLEHESPGVMAAVENEVRKSLSMQGIVLAAQGQALTVNVYHKGTDHARSFNWWILLFPVWPIVGLTQSHTTVYVESNAVDAAGRIVWTGMGEAKASAFLFSDFYYPSEGSILPDAASRAVRGVGSIATAPNKVTVQLATIRF